MSIADRYAPHQHVPLSGYLTTLAVFGVGFAAALVHLGRPRTPWGRGPRLGDVPLVGMATHKLTRIIAKDFVTAPLRAPFTERVAKEGGGEVQDRPRPGKLATLGDLVSCPYCLGPWVATGFSVALSVSPGPTRAALRILAAVAVSDFLHQIYSRLNETRKAALAYQRHVNPPTDTTQETAER